MKALEKIWPIIQSTALRHGLDPCLVGAIVMAESGGDTWAARFEPGVYESGRMLQDPKDRPRSSSQKTELVLQATSWGLMQVMGFNVRATGDLKGEWLHRLCEPEIGLEMGCKHLAGLGKRWPIFWGAVSAYNQGGPYKAESGGYRNQEYVNHVQGFFDQVRAWFVGENQQKEAAVPESDQAADSEYDSGWEFLDEVSKTRLATCDPRLQRLIRVAAENITLRVAEGYMAPGRVASLIGAGELLNSEILQSYVPSPAVVIAPANEAGRFDMRPEAFEPLVQVIHDLAKEMGLDLVWGGNMSPQPYRVKWRNDGYFEVRG